MFEDTIKTKINKSNLLPAFLEQLNSVSNQFQERFLSSWEKTHKAKLKSFFEIQETCLQRLDQLMAMDFQSSRLWRESETTIKKFLEQTESLQYIDDDYSAAKFWEEWVKRFDEVLQDVPSSHKIIMPKNYWEIKTHDSIKIRLWKLLKKKHILLKETGLTVINKFRTLFRKSSLPSFPIQRSILVHLFLKYHYEIPMAGFFLQVWQRFMQQIATQLHHIHETSEEMIEDLLFLEDIKDIYLKPDVDKLILRLQKAKERIPILTLFSENLDKFKVETKERFESYVTKLNEDIEHDWEYTGTYILPSTRSSEKEIEARWTSLQGEFDKNKKAWIKHFNGEAENWKKDLELSQLQVRILQICEETIDSLKVKINEQILPTFEEPLNMLSTSKERFKAINIKQEEDLKGEIITGNRFLLRSLRKEKLPHTLDTLLQAQLLKTLENYLSRVKHVVEHLPDQHTIFRYQDLKGLPPDSKFVDIPLKDLVLGEIYPELAKGYVAFTSDIQKKLDKIVRDISETDQIVEFNLEAAIELLEKGQEKDASDEAQNVVIEGLEQAQNQLNALVEQNRHIAELSADTLLQITSEFESQIQQLCDNEKIIALKLRVAKARTQEELRGYRKKVLLTIKSSLPSLLNFLSGYIKKIQNNYLRFRKITGLTPVAADDEEKLSRFVTRTQKQIARLPYVYQRLFRIEPLSDERFFEGREEVLELLRQEFELWQAGQYGVTAVIGEKGSGKTTLLNFATEQIYSKFPIVKIELAGSTISTEESLFLFFKDVLQEKEIGSLEELENKFMKLDRQRIIIVEDIQNLFLRMVDGFEALERFLLFVSRTHEKIYWLVTCTLYSWRYLDKVINISKFFQRVFFLGGLTREDIENIVLKRHRVSGYKLLFEAPDDIVHSKKFKKLSTDESRQEFLKNLYFNQLNDLATGNITVAMMFWLGAINKIEQDILLISSDMNLNFSFLYQLPAEELFTLAALLQHEMMNLEEHARVFHQDIHQSSLLLNRMTNRGILYEKSNGYYQTNFLLYRAVVRTLSMKNILH